MSECIAESLSRPFRVSECVAESLSGPVRVSECIAESLSSRFGALIRAFEKENGGETEGRYSFFSGKKHARSGRHSPRISFLQSTRGRQGVSVGKFDLNGGRHCSRARHFRLNRSRHCGRAGRLRPPALSPPHYIIYIGRAEFSTGGRRGFGPPERFTGLFRPSRSNGGAVRRTPRRTGRALRREWAAGHARNNGLRPWARS